MLRMTAKEYREYLQSRTAKSKGSAAHAKRKRVKSLAMRAADTRWSADVKAAAGLRCEECGGKGQAAHHVFTRSLKSTRHYVPNGVCLCNGHHFNAHKTPHDFRLRMIERRGEAWWADLTEKANTRHIVFKVEPDGNKG